MDLAERLAEEQGKDLRAAGGEYITNCLLPDHEDRTPSFSVNPEKGRFFCHGCIQYGDVVELARLAWGHSGVEAHVAAATLLMEFGHEPPARPESWFCKQKRRKSVLDAIEAGKVRRTQRRLFRWVLAPGLERSTDVEERENEARTAWDEAGFLARLMVAQLGEDA